MSDVNGVDLAHVTINGGGDRPVILLQNVQDFSAYQVHGMADMHLDQVEEGKF
jgi:hypothetical protein